QRAVVDRHVGVAEQGQDEGVGGGRDAAAAVGDDLLRAVDPALGEHLGQVAGGHEDLGLGIDQAGGGGGGGPRGAAGPAVVRPALAGVLPGGEGVDHRGAPVADRRGDLDLGGDHLGARARDEAARRVVRRLGGERAALGLPLVEPAVEYGGGVEAEGP